MSDTKNLDDAHYRQANGADAPAVDAHADLRKLAEAATPGPWMHLFGDRTIYDRMEDGCRGNAIACVDYPCGAVGATNLDYISAANPARIIALLDEVESLRAALAQAAPASPPAAADAGALLSVLREVQTFLGDMHVMPVDWTIAESTKLFGKVTDAIARPAAVMAGDLCEWRVAEFWSSSRPGAKVLMLATDEHLNIWGKHKDFIRWVTPDRPPAMGSASLTTPASPASAPEASEPMTTDQAREYLVTFMEQHFSDKTFHRYIMAGGHPYPLAGDFAWQMATALRRLAAPVEQAGVPVAWLRFWAAQRYTGEGNIECDEGYEVCRRDDKGVDGSPAFPVFAAPLPPVVARKDGSHD